MTDSNSFQEAGVDFDGLVRDAIPAALAEQDAKHFLAWMRAHMRDYFSDQLIRESQPGIAEALAWNFGFALWNALPLPRNGFRPEPISRPGRNESCPCGSGLKYKQCCLPSPAFPLKTADVWPAVLAELDAEQRQAALRSNTLPRSALVAMADEELEEGRTKSAVKLLEPLLLPQPVAHDESLAIAFDALCNAYDELGWHRKKAALIDGVIQDTSRSPLRSNAWQRRALMAMDRHDLAQARDAFIEAQRDDPEAPMLGILEVQLLLAEHESERARERAEFHARRLRRMGYSENEPPFNFLVRIAEDPIGVMSDFALDISDEAGRGLLDWLGTVKDRPLPAYRVVGADDQPAESVDLVAHLVKMGIPRDEAERAVGEMPETPEALEASEGEADATPEKTLYTLVASDALTTIEREWHDCFPAGKPFSVSNDVFDAGDIWDVEAERRWTAFLHAHPECFDSFDVLDDLATAAMTHPQSGLPSLDQAMLLPILERARDMLQTVVDAHPDLELAWVNADNRPALRSLARLSLVLHHARPREALAAAELLLRLNPNDNHGHRAMLINHRLEAGDNRGALAIAERYPDDDGMVEVIYGHPLALFRLGRKVEATAALRDALLKRPKVSDFLLRDKPRKPAISQDGVTYGGDDEAWLYRETMREAWQATPEAMAWLRAEDNRLRKRQGRSARPAPRRK